MLSASSILKWSRLEAAAGGSIVAIIDICPENEKAREVGPGLFDLFRVLGFSGVRQGDKKTVGSGT
jgi:hypothetical protein